MSSFDIPVNNIINNKFEESKINLKEKNLNLKENKKRFFQTKLHIHIILLFNIFIYIILIFIYINNKIKTNDLLKIQKKLNNLNLNNFEEIIYLYNFYKSFYNNSKDLHYSKLQNKEIKKLLINEQKMPHLKELNKKRTFNVSLPLPKEITCNPHFSSADELMAFMSFLTKDTIFFETGSGCSSLIAKYYSKKTYSIEGCSIWYKIGIENGLNDSLIFKDLKPDNPTWSYPGKESNIEDWKNYFQSYKKEYNADIIFIDGRFKTATAMDIFNKIKDDTVVLIHEYNMRPLYFILEDYYDYKYHWNTLYALMKKKDIKEIPLEIQMNYWNYTI